MKCERHPPHPPHVIPSTPSRNMHVPLGVYVTCPPVWGRSSGGEPGEFRRSRPSRRPRLPRSPTRAESRRYRYRCCRRPPDGGAKKKQFITTPATSECSRGFRAVGARGVGGALARVKINRLDSIKYLGSSLPTQTKHSRVLRRRWRALGFDSQALVYANKAATSRKRWQSG